MVIEGEAPMTSTWNKWIEKNWMEVEPEMKRVLKKTFKFSLYEGEFDDIIQEFVMMLKIPPKWYRIPIMMKP